MHIVVALILWGNVAASIVFFVYLVYPFKKAEYIPASKFRSFRHLFCIFFLMLRLGEILNSNIIT